MRVLASVGGRVRLLALMGVLMVVGAACQTEETEPAGPQAESPAPSPVPSPTPSPSPAAGTAVRVVDSTLGQVLADAQGRTVYVFMRDADGQSACSGACAQTWPPLVTTGPPQAGAGVNASLLGTTQREDGRSQVAYNRRPLYHYSGDQSPGQTSGQGVGGNWFVVSPAGEPVR